MSHLLRLYNTALVLSCEGRRIDNMLTAAMSDSVVGCLHDMFEVWQNTSTLDRACCSRLIYLHQIVIPGGQLLHQCALNIEFE